MDIVGPSEVTTNAADVPQPVTTMLGYLPSAFAHGCSVGKIKHKRKKQAKSLAAPASLSPERLLELEVEPKEPKAKANRILPQRALAAHLPLSASTYDEQQARIDRPNPGCFVGEPATLKRSHGRGRPPRSRLMIIKSLRLHDLGLTSDVSQNRFAEPKQTANLPQLQGFLSPRQDYTSPYPTNYQNGKSGSHFVTGDSVQVPDELPGLVSTPDPPILNSKRKHVAFADTQTFDRRKKQKLEGSGLNSQSMNAHRNPSQYPTDTIFSHDGSVQTSQDHPQVYNDQSRQNITFDRGSMVNERPASMLGASLPSDHHRQGPYSQLVEELLMEASPGSAIGSGYQSINPASSISDHQLSSHRATEDADERSGKTGESGKRTVPAPQSTQSTDKQRNRPSGSVKVERRNIIMDVVQKFEGVFSGEKELWYHFATVWMARHGGTKPDYRTVKETKKDLINSRKLKLLTFNFEFKPRNGVFEPRTITILTLPNVPSDDPKVRQLKDRMIAAQPAPYFPEGLEISRAVCLKYTKPPKPSTEPKPQSYTNKLALDVNTIVQRQFPTPEGQSKGQSKAGSMTRRSRKRPTDEENASPRKRQKPSNFIFMPIEVGPATPAYPVPSGDLDTLPKLTNRKPRQHVNGKPRQQVNGKQSQQVDGTQSQQVDGKQKQHTNGKHTTAAKLLQYSVLNPRQIFNNHNGTISSMFVPRIRLPRTKEVKISFSKDPPRGRPQDIVSFRPDDHDGDPKAIFDRKVDAIKQWEHLGGGFHSQSDGREFTFVNHLFEGVHNNTCALGISLKAPRSRRGTHKTSVKEPKPHTARKLRARGDGKPIVKAKPPVEQPTLVDSDGRKFKRIRLRGPQRGKILGQDGDHRLFLGVVIARTLVGGVSQIVDWNIVAKMFEPQASEASLKSAWPRTRELLKSVGEKWQSDFQEMFAQAYATGAIPMVDYDNLKSYDWKHLFDWTWERFSSPSQSQAEISASTTGFTTLHELDGNPLQDMTAFYELRSNATVHKRDDIVNRDPFLVSVDTERLSDRTNLMDVAKNWIRANVLTPDGLYAPWEARRKIEPIGPKRVTKAIRELLLAKVITQKNKGRVLPTQGFKISSHFNNRLRLKFGLDKLYEAAAQKQRLDGLFKQGKRAQFSSHCSDGEMMAVSNLLAQGRIKSYQNNVPKNSFGLLDDGYRTRMMDRTKLHFDIELERSETYIEGNPLEPLPSIPTVVCQKVEEGHSFDKVPMWANFDGVADLSRWHSALAATIAIVVQRPGVVVSQIQIIVAPSLEPFEIKLLMDWMVKARIARWTGPWCDGVVLGEWWWMALGDERKSGAKATTSVAHG